MARDDVESFLKNTIDLGQATEYLDIIRKELISLENNYVWTTQDSSIETIDLCRKIIIVNTILNNPERLPLDDIFEEIMQTELNGRYNEQQNKK